MPNAKFLHSQIPKRRGSVVHNYKLNISETYLVNGRAANEYYSSAGHHEWKNKKTTGQIKLSAVTRKQQIKLVLRHSLYKNEFNVLVQVLPLHSLTRSPGTTSVCFLCSNDEYTKPRFTRKHRG